MINNKELPEYKRHFIEFLVEAKVLTFGDFVTKSGRNTPYFVNTGNFESGSTVSRVGEFYAEHILNTGLVDICSVFGPAYKGVPLAVSTAISLFKNHQLDIGYTFNRKEAKEHGDRGELVGRKLKAGDEVVIVEDVITAGTTLQEIVPLLREKFEVTPKGVVIAVDRCERGKGELSAVEEVYQQLGVMIYPIANIYEVMSHLSSENGSGFLLSSDLITKMNEYLAKYGATRNCA